MPRNVPPLVELENIAYTRNNTPILQNCSMQIMPGAVHLITGANGAGKSTLLRILAGRTWPDPGIGSREFTIAGVQSSSPLAVKPFIRLVSPESQERFLNLRIPLSLQDYIITGIDDVDYAPMFVGVTTSEQSRMRRECADLLREFLLESTASELLYNASHGIIRRAAIARALIARPHLLLLDEARDGLDAESLALVNAALRRRISTGALTIVTTAHEKHSLLAESIFTFKISNSTVTALTDPVRGSTKTVPAGTDNISRQNMQSESAPEKTPQPALNSTSGGEVLIELKNISVRYEHVPVLKDISLTVSRGGHFALIGANGAGKSTLAGVIQGTIPIAAGTAFRLDRTRRLPRHELQRRIMLLSDAVQLRVAQAQTTRELLLTAIHPWRPPHEGYSESEQAAVGRMLTAFELTPIADKNYLHLSFGQRRFALLARALLNDPELIILDEIFDGLDELRRGMLNRELQYRAGRGCTVIVISHKPELIPEFITSRVLLAAGRISSEPSRYPVTPAPGQGDLRVGEPYPHLPNLEQA